MYKEHRVVKGLHKPLNNTTRTYDVTQYQKSDLISLTSENIKHDEKHRMENRENTGMGSVFPQNVINSPTTNTSQGINFKNKKIFEENGAATRSKAKINKVKARVQNESRHNHTKPKIIKTSATKRNSSEQVQRNRAKKLLDSFFASELNDTENATSSHENETRKAGIKSNDKKKEHTMKQHNATQHTALTDKNSQQVYKRYKLQYNGRVEAPMQNDKVVETFLPSGPSVDGPQHVRVSSQPTHILFKPVHKYYPAIHRYMTSPIHRFLKKPVNLGGLAPQIAIPQQIKAQPVLSQQAGVPQAIHPGNLPQNVVSTGVVSAPHLAAVRMYASMPPRIQPVLMHPHRLSTTGTHNCFLIIIKVIIYG